MKTRTILVASVLVIAAACGGGEEDTTTTAEAVAGGTTPVETTTATTTQAATTTSAGATDGDGGGGAGNAWCAGTADDIEFGGALTPSLDAEALRDLMNQLVDRIGDAQSTAPSEIRDDVATVADAIRTFRDTLESFDYNFFALIAAAEEDPSLLEPIESEELQAATDRIADFCDIDLDAGGDGGDIVGSGELPAGFPEALVPPDSTFVSGFEGGGILTADFTTTASLEDVVAFYTAELGNPTVETEGETSWFAMTDTGQMTVIVTHEAGDVRIGVVMQSG